MSAKVRQNTVAPPAPTRLPDFDEWPTRDPGGLVHIYPWSTLDGPVPKGTVAYCGRVKRENGTEVWRAGTKPGRRCRICLEKIGWL